MYQRETGASGTSWSAYSVPEMWELVGDYDVNPQWTHVAGWRKTYELTELHLAHIRSYRDQLATAWPPDKNEASRAYVAELDKLIESVQSTYDAAVANHDTMAGATGAIMMAKRDLKPIYDRWQANATTMAQFEAQVAAANSGTPAPMPGPPPLPVNWREDLNRQARTLMSGLSSELSLAAVKLVVPPDYAPPRPGTREPATNDDSGNTTVLVPPVIPSVVPRPAPSVPWQTSGSSGPGGPILTGGTALPGMGAMPTLPSPPTTVVAPPVGLPQIPGVIGSIPGPVNPIPNGSGSRGGPNVIGASPPGRTTGPAPGVVARPSPPGAVIGASPGAGLAQPGIASRSTQRVNPPGGVIGGRQPSAPGAQASQSYRPNDGRLAAVSPASGAQRSRRQERSDSWDPDNPWITVDGVNPVVEPSPDPGRHDPGPAIGLGR